MVSISPNCNWPSFDLPSYIYRVSAGGKNLRSLMQDGSMAINDLPGYSLDRKWPAQNRSARLPGRTSLRLQLI